MSFNPVYFLKGPTGWEGHEDGWHGEILLGMCTGLRFDIPALNTYLALARSWFRLAVHSRPSLLASLFLETAL